MPSSDFSLQDDFSPVSYESWREQADAELQKIKDRGVRTREGVRVKSLYTREDSPNSFEVDSLPGNPPFVRGGRSIEAKPARTDLRQEHAHPDIATTQQAIADDIAGGASSVLIRFDALAADGRDLDDAASQCDNQPPGVMIFDVDDLDAALAGVDLAKVGMALDTGAAFLPGAAMLAALWRRRGVDGERARGAFNADPFAVLARTGQLPYSPEVALSSLGDLAVWASTHFARVTSVGVDTSAYHHAGATDAQDLALGLATGVAYLRAMTAGDQLAIDAAARQILFRMSLGTDHFLAIAKLRAARRLWWQVIEACGGSLAAGGLRIHARLSDRVLTHQAPHVNTLRNTACVFAALVGSAEAVTSVPFDHVVRLPDLSSRRLARNTVLLLEEEAHLHRVADSAGGSWLVEKLTDQLAEEAWAIFQTVEQRGGLLAALQSGWVHEQVDAAYAARAADVADRVDKITGVTDFSDANEKRIERPALDLTALRAVALRTKNGRPKYEPPISTSTAKSQTAAAIEAVQRGATIGQVAAMVGFHVTTVQVEPFELRRFAQPFERIQSEGGMPS